MQEGFEEVNYRAETALIFVGAVFRFDEKNEVQARSGFVDSIGQLSDY